MTEQELKDLKYLQQAIRNGTTAIEGCMREARKYLQSIEVAITAYSEELVNEDSTKSRGNVND